MLHDYSENSNIITLIAVNTIHSTR